MTNALICMATTWKCRFRLQSRSRTLKIGARGCGAGEEDEGKEGAQCMILVGVYDARRR